MLNGFGFAFYGVCWRERARTNSGPNGPIFSPSSIYGDGNLFSAMRAGRRLGPLLLDFFDESVGYDSRRQAKSSQPENRDKASKHFPNACDRIDVAIAHSGHRRHSPPHGGGNTRKSAWLFFVLKEVNYPGCQNK